MSKKKIDYANMDDETMRALIFNSLTKRGHTAAKIGQQFDISVDRSKRLLTDLKRHRRIYIRGWVGNADDGRYRAVYVPGKGNNAPKPTSQFAHMTVRELAEHIIKLLPNSRGTCAKKLQVSAKKLEPVFDHLVASDKVIADEPTRKNGTVIFHLKENYVAPVEAPQPVKKVDLQLTIPWAGYNVHPEGQQIRTEWRHAI